MADFQSYDPSTEFSGFGGKRLVPMGVAAFAISPEDDPLSELAELGITDAEQLVATASIPDTLPTLATTLGLDVPSVTNLVAGVSQMFSPARAALVSTPAPADLALGALLPSAEELATLESPTMAFAMAAAVLTLPTSINLIPFMSPIRNQASRGTCVSFALTALNEYVQGQGGVSVDLSEQFLYYQT